MNYGNLSNLPTGELCPKIRLNAPEQRQILARFSVKWASWNEMVNQGKLKIFISNFPSYLPKQCLLIITNVYEKFILR